MRKAIKKLVLILGMAAVLSLTACVGVKSQEATTNNEEVVTTTNQSEQAEASYEGEYNSFDTDEPNLQIQKNEDGTYNIEIGIYRITTLDCTGKLTESGIEFKDEIWDAYGNITFKDDIATVKIESPDWIDDITEYKYRKVSDIPFNSFRKLTDEEKNIYVGKYKDSATGEVNLEIQINEDDTDMCRLRIVIPRVTAFDVQGRFTAQGIVFYVYEYDFSVDGRITIDGDVATVSIESPDWIDDVSEYKYFKITDAS